MTTFFDKNLFHSDLRIIVHVTTVLFELISADSFHKIFYVLSCIRSPGLYSILQHAKIVFPKMKSLTAFIKDSIGCDARIQEQWLSAIINVPKEFCQGDSFSCLRKFPSGVKFKQDLTAIPMVIWNRMFHMHCSIISKEH